MTISPSGTTCYQNSSVFCSLTTKDEKLTSCTQTHYWLASEAFTTNTRHHSEKMSRLSKTQPLLPRQKNCKSSHLLNGSGESMICALPQGLDVQLRLPVSINVFEMQVIMLRFQLLVKKWVSSKVIVYNSSTTAISRLWLQILQGPLNQLLRNIMQIAAVNDILVEPRWLDFKANDLANAFSRFNEKYIANIYPSWQDLFTTIL